MRLGEAEASLSGARQRPLAVGSHPRLEPRLVRAGIDAREDLEAYRALGGYARGSERAELIDAVEAAGLRGRGGAAFPTGLKLRAVAEQPGPRYVIANGEEGEPASVKDRWLLRARPHLVLDGLLRAAGAVDAERAYVYLSDAAAAASVRAALDELEPQQIPLELVTVEPGYVAGEETAAVRAIGGGPALPTVKPPRPYEEGIAGQPTLVLNVETLANVPLVAVEGPERFRALGSERSAGTFLLTVSGGCERPGLYELPLGEPLGAALGAVAGLPRTPRGFLMGGFFAGLLGPRALELPLGYDELQEAGSGLGCGAIVVLGQDECPVGVAADVLAYFASENAKQCGACIKGTAAMRDVVAALGAGDAGDDDVERLRRWAGSLPGRGACALLDGAAALAGSLLREFPGEVENHLAGPCSRCLATPPGRAGWCRFVLEAPTPAKERS